MKSEDIQKQHAICRGILRQLRTSAGLRQTELAHLLDQPQSYVSKYETGERQLDLVEVRRICLALGITFEEFVRRFEELVRET